MSENLNMINATLNHGKQFFIQCFFFGSPRRFLNFHLLWNSIRNNTVIINKE